MKNPSKFFLGLVLAFALTHIFIACGELESTSLDSGQALAEKLHQAGVDADLLATAQSYYNLPRGTCTSGSCREEISPGVFIIREEWVTCEFPHPCWGYCNGTQPDVGCR